MAGNGSDRNDRKNQQAFPTQSAPNRENCPIPDLIQAVAVKALPFNHPAVQHVGTCDFCLQDVTRIRTARKRRAAAVLASLAAVVLFGIVFTWIYRTHTLATRPTTALAVDLRPFAPLRGDVRNNTGAVPILPRKNLQLSFVLPIGLPAGEYEVRLMNEQLNVVRETGAEAFSQGHEVHLSTNLDLSALRPGEYRLWIRRQSGSWRDYPLQIR
jgi:hypothetical protein